MKSNKKRFFAVLVAALMMFQLSAVNVMALDTVSKEKSTQIDSECDFTDCITSAQIKAKVGDNWYDVEELLNDGKTVPKDAPIDVRIAYNPALKDAKFLPGAKLIYQIPAGIKLNEEQIGIVKDGPEEAGRYVIDTNGRIVITLDETYLKNHNGFIKNGTIAFSGSFDGSYWGQGGNKEIQLGQDRITIPFKPDEVATKGVVNIAKTGANGAKNAEIKNDKYGYYIDYQITVSAPDDNTMTMKEITVEDTFGNLTYVAMEDNHPDIFGIEADTGKLNFTASGFTWTNIGDMEKGQSHTLKFKVRIKNDIYAAGDVGERKIINNAVVKSEGNLKNKTSITTTENSGLGITKTAGKYNSKTGTVEYTVQVTAPANNTWPIENVTVKDVFRNNAKFVEDYVSHTPDDTSVVIDETKKTVDWNIGVMNKGEKKTLKYTVKVDDDIFLNGNTGTISQTLDNKATLYVDGNKRDETNASVKFEKTWINKEGVIEDGKVKFTITANTPDRDAVKKGVTFSDSLSKDWVYEGNLSVVKKNSADQTQKCTGLPSINGKSEWSWTDIQTADGPYTYVITYYAKYIGPELGPVKVENNAGMDIGIGEPGKTPDYSFDDAWEKEVAKYDSLTKCFVSIEGNDNEKVANWQSKITCDVPSGTVYKDWRGTAKPEDGHEWWFTDEQMAAITVIKQTKISDEIINTPLARGINYTVTREGTGFKLTFSSAFDVSEEEPILIKYSSTLKTDDLKENQDAKYVNRAVLEIDGHKDSAKADCTYTKPMFMKKTAGEYDPSTGNMTWNIYVNVTGDLNGEATVTDVLPEELDFVKAEITAKGEKAVDTQMNVSTEGQTVTMNLTGLKATGKRDAYVAITLTTKVVDEDFFTGNVTQKFTNTATLEYGSTTKTSAADQTITNTALSKSGLYNSNTAPDIIYTIKVNPSGIDMLKGADKIRVKDTMGENMLLNTSSLLVMNTKTNTAIDVTGTLKIDGNEFEFEVPDDVPIVITYRAYVMGEVGDEASVTNTVAYYGNEPDEAVKEENKIIISESNATLESDPAFYICKKDANDINTLLQGAEFTLYKVNEDGTLGDVEIVAVSDEQGNVIFSGLDEDTVYAFCETKAPDEYYISGDNAEKTYVAFKKDVITEQMKDLNVNVIQSGITYERYNEKFFGSLELTKTNGKDGDAKKVLEGAEFELYQNIEGKEAELIDTLVTDRNGILQKDGLKEGSYYLVETKAPKDYEITVDENGDPVKYPFEIGPYGGEQVVNYNCEVANEAIEKDGLGIKTGDDTHFTLWVTLMIFAAAGAAVCMRKKTEKNHRKH